MTKELVAHVVKQLVNYPNDVHISISQSGDKNFIEITVNEKDRGKVIGREGQIIKAIRMLVNATVVDNKKNIVDVAR